MTTVNTIIFEASGDAQPRGNRWAAYAEPSGITAFGSTQQEAIDRATNAVQFFIQTIHFRRGVDVARQYLDSHGVHSTVFESEAVGSTRYRSEVRSNSVASLTQ